MHPLERDPSHALAEAVAEAADASANGLSALEALEDAQRDRDVYLVLDQAEEYFCITRMTAGRSRSPRRFPAC